MRKTLFLLVLICTLASSATAQPELRELNTRHYHIHTDLDDALARDLGTRMDAMYDEYAQRLSIFKPKAHTAPLEVYLFRRESEYTRFTNGHMRNSGGVFLAGYNLLAAFLEGQGRDQLRRTLQHEAFHQFAHNVISPRLPVWLNEGLAQFFEEGLWNGDGFKLGEVPPRRIRQLQADIKADRLIEFRKLLTMTSEQWSRRLVASREDGNTQYNQSWAMVHFLVRAQDSRGEFLYRSYLVDMLRNLNEGKDGTGAFRLAFGTNIQGFQDRFVEYAQSLRPTPEATMIENQSVLADMLIDFDHKGKRFGSMESFRTYAIRGRYQMRYSSGSLQWDTGPNIGRYFCDLSGRTLGSSDLYFSIRSGAALPDMVCRYGQIAFRTRFYDSPQGGVEHELIIEPLQSSVSIR
ncbi:MAG TPA: DUF1570 domain-containing protein [Tepidisphaeraceae bacterium]|nr:DUF1570 domain-containing protein [Tepidisphaeraceae bacterium]